MNCNTIFWVDPINNNPHFLDLICKLFIDNDIPVTVYSNIREKFPKTIGIEWKYFLRKSSISPSPTMGILEKIYLSVAYVLGWEKTIKDIERNKVRTILFSSSMRLPDIDSFYLRKLNKKGIKCILLMHRPFYGLSIPKGRHFKAIKSLMDGCTNILCMTNYSASLASQLYDIDLDKFTVFPHPHYELLLKNIELDTNFLAELTSWCNGTPMVLYMSTLQISNGVTDLADSIPIIHSKIPDCHFLLLGNDYLEGKSELAKSIQLRFENDPRIKCKFGFYDYSEVKSCFTMTSVMAVPYRDVVQSGVVPMAAGEGIPVVVTKVGGLPEMILPGVTGEICFPKDPKDLADKICTVVLKKDAYKARTLKIGPEIFCPKRCYKILYDVLFN